MTKRPCSGSIALVAVGFALLWSDRSEAQGLVDGARPVESGGLVNRLATGVWYDAANRAAAEKRLPQVEARYRRDVERGHAAASGRDARKINALKYRIVVDEWLIRQNSLCDPGPYPFPLRLDPISCAAIAQAATPIYRR